MHMKQLTVRQKNIIKILQESSENISGKIIADTLSVSLRTIQNDMNELKKLGIISANKTGYSLTGQSTNTTCIEEDDRKSTILQYLLSSNKPLNIFDLAEKLYISESLLQLELAKIKNDLKIRNLTLTIKNNTISITGNEFNKRQLLKQIIYSKLPSNVINIENLSSYFKDMDVKKIHEIIDTSIEANGYHIHDSCSSSLLFNIIIALYRISKGMHMTELNNHLTDKEKQTVEYRLACDVCNRFGLHYGIHIQQQDILYIANLFKGNIISSNKSINMVYSNDFNNQISEILLTVLNQYMITVDVTQSIQNLALHVYELIKRAEHNSYVSNQIKTTIKENCPLIYDIAVSFAKSIETSFNIIIPDEEIGFLSVYIGFIIENAKEYTNKIQVLLYANNYQHIANNIENRLISKYKDQISIHVVNSDKDTLPDKNFDIIISTLHLEIIGRKVIMISPFLTKDDLNKIDEEINECLHKKELKRNNEFLMSCFNPKLFFIDNTINTKEKAISFLCSKMTEFGIVSDGFYESVIERERLSSTCFFNSFAIPHALIMNAKETMLAILINRKSIQWDDNNIKLVILIAVKKGGVSEFSKVYEHLAKVLCSPVYLSNLIQCNTYSEVLQAIKFVK